MIKKIKKIQNLGIFNDYIWNTNLPEFKKYNLFYGWNGSGKTTLTKLFSAFTTGGHDEFQDLKYTVELENASSLSQGQAASFGIRVFNQEYVAQNINFEEGKANPILMIGQDKIQEKNQLDELKRKLEGDAKNGIKGLVHELTAKQTELKKLQTERNSIFTKVAKIISEGTSGVTARNYRKPEAEKAFSNLAQANLLDDQVKQTHKTTLSQTIKPEIQLILLPPKEGVETARGATDLIAEFSNFIQTVKSTLIQTVEIDVLEDLKNDERLSTWTEAGLKIHQEYQSKDCLFCKQSLPNNLIEKLLGHFNKSDQELKQKIDSQILEASQLEKSLSQIDIPDKANLYDELQNEYDCAKSDLESVLSDAGQALSRLNADLTNKKSKTTERVEYVSDFEVQGIQTGITSVNKHIKTHNQKSKGFEGAKKQAQSNLETHFLSEIYDEVKDLDIKIKECDLGISELKNGNPDDPQIVGITGIKNQISILEKQISDHGIACDELSTRLANFLGRKELEFTIAEQGGYIIRRNEKRAKQLSEGEKTAVAFIHFVIHLEDKSFDKSTGVVVVDDPISSLDSNSLFQAFAFLKAAVKDVSQVFLFTHNYEFLKLLLGWLRRGKKEKISPRKSGQNEFYMINNNENNGNRLATIQPLDPLLASFETEYQYLYQLLKHFKSDGTIASVYHIPNVARKVLEHFLSIAVPNFDKTYEKLEKVEFDEVKKTAINKFANEQSHICGSGFDPSLVQECQKNVTYLLEMIAKALPSHAQYLDAAIGTGIESTQVLLEELAHA